MLRADVQIGRQCLHVFNVHLGTALLERRYQAGRLSAFVNDHRVTGAKIVLGDLNEWLKGETTRMLDKSMKSIDLRKFLRRRRTYPGVFPVLHLDHIYYDGAIEVIGVELPRTRLTLVASDHLPLVAEVSVRARVLIPCRAPCGARGPDSNGSCRAPGRGTGRETRDGGG